MMILFTDFYSAANKGDAAILLAMKKKVLQLWPKTKIHVMSYHPESVSVLLNMESSPVLVRSLTAQPIEAIRLLFGAVIYRVSGLTMPGSRLQLLADCEIIISVGGGHINGAYPMDLSGRLFGHLIAYIMGKRTAFYAQSIGPFYGKAIDKFVCFILNRASQITLREKHSLCEMKKIGAHCRNVTISADSVFSIDAETDLCASLHEGTYKSKYGPYVTVSVRNWGSGSESYAQTMARFLKRILSEQPDLRVIFVSTCTNICGYHKDDREFARSIAKVIGSDRAVVIDEELSLSQLAGFYKGARVHIGTRMHSCILAWLSLTPFVPIMYEFKTRYVLELAGLATVVHNYSDLNEDKLFDHFSSLLLNRCDEVERLRGSLAHVRQLENNNQSAIIKAIEGAASNSR